MAHDFKLWPELTNNQMQIYYFDSPHKQIVEDFPGKVVKITDGDTIHVKWAEREKPVVIRFINTAAPELDERGGLESQVWLASQILGEDVDILINPNNRVEKWGRILGEIIHMGMNINQMSIDSGHAISWADRKGKWF